MITVRVGKDQKQFEVHKGLLCHYSEYFEAQFNGRWGDANTVALENTDETSFQSFMHFIYAQRLANDLNKVITRKDKKRKTNAVVKGAEASSAVVILKTTPKTNCSYTLHALCRMFVLGDFLLCPGYKFAAMDAICDLMADQWRDEWSEIDYVYKHTGERSGLRCFFVDWFSESDNKEWTTAFRERRHDLPADFLSDLIITLHELNVDASKRTPCTQTAWKERDRCAYHEHDKK